MRRGDWKGYWCDLYRTSASVTKLRQNFASTLAWAIVALMAAICPAMADDASPWVTTAQTEVRLIAATDGADGDGTVRLGLQFKLKDGWKIYWRRPGDAGFPPRLEWFESENFAEADFAWPAPVRFQVLGFQTMGYAKEVVFPITVRLADPKQPLKARVRLDYLTCDEVCIPYFAQLALDIPPRGGQTTEHAATIEAFRARVPGDGSADGISIDRVETAGPFRRVDGTARNGAVRVQASSTIPFAHPDVFIEGPDLAFFGAPEVRYSQGGKHATLSVPVTLEDDANLEAAPLRITFVDGARSAERYLTVVAGIPSPAALTAPRASFAFILALALGGGFILNLMPCVLPVLSLKVLGFAAQGGQPRARIRASFIASAAGVVVSFLAIAGAIALLKLAGAEVGWGIQFQNPWFVGTLAAVTLLFAANLIGLFHIPLPQLLASTATGPIGSNGVRQSSIVGDFATGAFATLLATPCSAPFLGTAVGFALAGQITDIFAVFAAMGLGMALPYIAVALAPQIAGWLPRPGLWMVRLKQFLGFGLAATAVWLIAIASSQVGAPESSSADARRNPKDTPAHWRPFEPAAIPALVAEGKTVFVDITADWCITCQVNKVAVLDRAPVLALLQRNDVVAMRGDWTRADATISSYLQSFGRYAIPFNAVYGPGQPNGQALSELLRSSVVIEALVRASEGALASHP